MQTAAETMPGQRLEVFRESWRSMSCWLCENHHVIVFLSVLAAQTTFVQRWLELVFLSLSKSRLVPSNIVSSLILTRAFFNRREPNLIFVLWLCSMLLECNYLVLAPFGSFRIRNFTIPWMSTAQLVLIIYGCTEAARSTFLPGQRRIATNAARSSIWEKRDLKEIMLVSFPAFSPIWLSQSVINCQEVAARYWQKIISTFKRLGMLEPFSQLGLVVLSSSIMVYSLLNMPLFRNHRKNLFGIPFLLVSTIRDPSRLWFIQDLIFHQALEVDGMYYELSRSGWFANSITLNSLPVKKDDRKVLARRSQGYTFFTANEILNTGESEFTGFLYSLPANVLKHLNSSIHLQGMS